VSSGAGSDVTESVSEEARPDRPAVIWSRPGQPMVREGGRERRAADGQKKQ
jgi:hypothetical protein